MDNELRVEERKESWVVRISPDQAVFARECEPDIIVPRNEARKLLTFTGRTMRVDGGEYKETFKDKALQKTLKVNEDGLDLTID